MTKKLFTVAAMQTELEAVQTKADIHKNLDLFTSFIDNVVPYMSMVTGAPCRLVAFPEFFIQGNDLSWTVADWLERAITIPGEETEKLGKKARQHNIYISGAAYVVEPEWPDRVFNEAFVIDPEGKIVLIYHKLATAKDVEVATAPFDMYDAYVKKYGDGLDDFFPVAETEIGRMGVMICYDGAFPEIGRGLAMNGAEIIIRPTTWVEPITSEPQNIWAVQNQFHAFSNACYVVAPNGGIITSRIMPKGVLTGNSMVVDYRGRILAQTKTTNESVVGAEINIHNLRAVRRDCGFIAMLPHIQSELFSKIYEKPVWPKNCYLDKPGTVADNIQTRQKVIQQRKDMFVSPES